MSEHEFEALVKQTIDRLKAHCNEAGLAGGGFEYKIITELFVYKFLNDKVLYEYKKSKGLENATFDKIDENDFNDFADAVGVNTATIHYDHLDKVLFGKINEDNFHEYFDQILLDISDDNEDVFSIKTTDNEKVPLFTGISNYVTDRNKKLRLARQVITTLSSVNFEKIFDKTFDFFSVIFEYLIGDYNKDAGAYAEYYTPAVAGRIIAEILFDGSSDKKDNIEIYDSSAGSGMLLMCLAHKIGVENCTVFSQDISQKSSEFLRINLMLNGLVDSLHNILQGNTLAEPGHITTIQGGSSLRKFDYIVGNPPFKMDFSDIIEDLKSDTYNRFTSETGGIPNVPKNKKDSMPIYIMFIQHIIKSLKENGKAAIVVPSGFCSASKGIEYDCRKYLIDNNMLTGVISMPSNIFSNTGTNVSLIFIEKNNTKTDVCLMDASNMGSKIKVGKTEKTVLSKAEEESIINLYKDRKDVEGLIKVVSVEKTKENGIQINPGRYFDIKVDTSLTYDELDSKLSEISLRLTTLFVENNILQEAVEKYIKDVVSDV